MTYHYSFKDCLQRAERINWRVEDLIGPGKRLDFSRPFMPEGLAWTQSLSFLSDDEKRTLNQIRGHAYLAIFGLVEEFILPFVLDHARPHLSGDDERVRASSPASRGRVWSIRKGRMNSSTRPKM